MNKALFFAACLLIGLTACNKVNPYSGLTPAQEREILENRAIASVLSTLTGKEEVNFEGKTFKPVYGVVLDESNPGERSMKVQGEEFSKSYFRAITGGSTLIKETLDGLLLDLSARKFGKLTYHIGSGNNSGYVDVEIPCIPSLSKISFKTSDQWGENAGEASIFKFGDVLKDRDGHYYLVIREVDDILPGFMLCVQPGRGDDFHYFKDNEPEGPWLPNNNYSLFYDSYPDLVKYGQTISSMLFEQFVYFCEFSKYRDLKKRIVEATGRNVFPDVALYSEDSEFVANGYEGFATLRDGYAHYLGDVGVDVRFVNVITSCDLLDDGRAIVHSSYISADCQMEPPYPDYFFYDSEQSFQDQFYEGQTLAVYTVLSKAFTNSIYPDYEKVEY